MMNEKIYDLLNDVKTDFNEYDSQTLSSEETRQIETRVLQEVRKMKKANRKTSKTNKGLKAAISAAACAAVLLTVSSQTNAKEFLSSTFQELIAGSADEKYAKEDQELYTSIGKQATQLTSESGETLTKDADNQKQILTTKDAGVTMRASDVYCDGYMLYYTLVLETENKDLMSNEIDGIMSDFTKDGKQHSFIKVDGEDDGWVTNFQRQKNGSFISMQNTCLYAQSNPKTYQDGDIIPIEIEFNQFAGVDYDSHDADGEYVHTEPLEGNWKLYIPAKVETSRNRTQKLNLEDNNVKLKSVTKAKATLNLKLEEPNYALAPYNDKYNDPDIEIKDKNGNTLQWAGCYDDIREDGSHILSITLIDNGADSYILEVTNKNVDGEVIAQIEFPVER